MRYAGIPPTTTGGNLMGMRSQQLAADEQRLRAKQLQQQMIMDLARTGVGTVATGFGIAGDFANRAQRERFQQQNLAQRGQEVTAMSDLQKALVGLRGEEARKTIGTEIEGQRTLRKEDQAFALTLSDKQFDQWKQQFGLQEQAELNAIRERGAVAGQLQREAQTFAGGENEKERQSKEKLQKSGIAGQFNLANLEQMFRRLNFLDILGENRRQRTQGLADDNYKRAQETMEAKVAERKIRSLQDEQDLKQRTREDEAIELKREEDRRALDRDRLLSEERFRQAQGLKGMDYEQQDKILDKTAQERTEAMRLQNQLDRITGREAFGQRRALLGENAGYEDARLDKTLDAQARQAAREAEVNKQLLELRATLGEGAAESDLSRKLQLMDAEAGHQTRGAYTGTFAPALSQQALAKLDFATRLGILPAPGENLEDALMDLATGKPQTQFGRTVTGLSGLPESPWLEAMRQGRASTLDPGQGLELIQKANQLGLPPDAIRAMIQKGFGSEDPRAAFQRFYSTISPSSRYDPNQLPDYVRQLFP